MDPITIMTLDRIVQWLVIPILMGIVFLYKQSNMHDREILRILTILEERNRRRDEDKKETEDTNRQLRKAIELLTSKIDALAIQQSHNFHNHHDG